MINISSIGYNHSHNEDFSVNDLNGINNELLNIFNKFIEIMKNTSGVVGAWHFGSVMHGMSDRFSDIDVVFLIDPRHFSEMEEYCTNTLRRLCSKVVLCWEEEFNSSSIVNNGYLLEAADSIFQFDIFMLNSSHIICAGYIIASCQKRTLFLIRIMLFCLCSIKNSTKNSSRAIQTAFSEPICIISI